MKIFNKSQLIFSIILMCLTIYTSSTAQDWGLEINLEKQNYILHEEIWLDVTITNITNNSIRTNGIVAPNHFGFEIEIQDSSGKLLSYSGPNWDVTAGEGSIFLEPNQQEYECFNLTSFYNDIDDFSGYSVLPLYFPFISKGNYTVQAKFDGVSSNILSFTIEEPSDDEKKTLEIIEEASSVLRRDDYDPAGQKFQEVIDKFPNSVFAASCFRLSKTFTNEAKQARRLGIFDGVGLRRELIQNYPNSGETQSWLKYLLYELEQSEKEKVIKKTIEKHPNSRSAKFAKQMFQGMPNKMKK